jgi:hypothetical protein
VPLSRITWLVTVAIFLVTALILFLDDYVGYGAVAVTIAIAAAINVP